MRSLLFLCLAFALPVAAQDGGSRAPVSDPLLEPVPAAPRELGSWEEAVQLFSQRSTDLRIAAAEVVRARGLRRQAIGALLPQASGNALASFSLISPPEGIDPAQAALYGVGAYQTVGLVASLAVIDVRAWNQVAQAMDGVKATRLSLEDSRRLLLLNLAQLLLNTVAAENLADLNRVGLRDSLERLALTEKATRAGASTEIDLGRTRQDAEVARAQVVSGDEQVRQAREALGFALAVDQPVSVRSDFQLNGLADRVLGQCRAIAGLDERPDVKAAKAREEIAHRGVLDVKAQFLPTIGIRTNAQAFVFAGGAIPIWNFQAVLTVPIWDGGSRYGALSAAHALEAEAAARSEAVERTGRIDIERTRRGIEVATRSRDIAQKALTQAERIDALTRRAYDAGLGTSLELVTAASQLRQSQLTLALREYDVLRARVVALFALAECAS